MESINPISGELENNIGSMIDNVTPKRASLGSGYVEVLSLLRTNKDRMQHDARFVHDLPNATWKEYISRRIFKLSQLLPRDFAAEGGVFNDQVDCNVVERNGDSGEFYGFDIRFGLLNTFELRLKMTFLTFKYI